MARRRVRDLYQHPLKRFARRLSSCRFFSISCFIGAGFVVIMSAGVATATASTPGKAQLVPRTPRFWTLADLGTRGSVPLTTRQPQITVARFRLPSGARQGPRFWYTMRLILRVTPSRRLSSCVATGYTSGYAAAHVQVTSRNGKAIVDSLGWISGHKHFAITRPTTVEIANYLQESGVHSGLVQFEVALRRVVGRCEGTMSVQPGSGVGVTRARPDELVLTGPDVALRARPHDVVKIPFSLSRRGSRPDRSVIVALQADPALHLLASRRQTFSSIGTGKSGAFLVRADRAGTYGVEMAVLNAYNQPQVIAEIVVRPGTGSAAWGAEVYGAAAGIGGVAGIALLARRRRKSLS